MELNNIKPAEGSKKNRRRVGRGIGSGLGKTAGRGHKGQSRVPAASTKSVLKAAKCRCSAACPSAALFRFRATTAPKCACRVGCSLPVDTIDLMVLKQAGVIPAIAEKAKVILAGKLDKEGQAGWYRCDQRVRAGNRSRRRLDRRSGPGLNGKGCLN